MFPLIGSLIGAGSNLLSGLFGQQEQQSNIAAQEQINAQNVAEQEKFAQQGIQWRVADAKAAGINPLAALGAQTGSFSNIVAPSSSGNAMGTGVAAAGQDLSRAIAATRSPEEHAAAIEKTRLDLESSQLDNEIKRATLASSVKRLQSAQVGPGLPKAETVVRNPDGSLTSGPSRTTEGWSWTNPVAKDQWLMGHEMPQWFGYGIPDQAQTHQPGMATYRNPFTGSYYQDRAHWYDYYKDLYGFVRSKL